MTGMIFQYQLYVNVTYILTIRALAWSQAYTRVRVVPRTTGMAAGVAGLTALAGRGVCPLYRVNM